MNPFERACKEHLERQGYHVLRNGWPDFLVLSRDYSRGYALELKRGQDKLSAAQIQMHAALARFGILTHVLKDNAGLQAIKKGRAVYSYGDLRGMREDLHNALDYANAAIQLVNQLREQIDLCDAVFTEPLSSLLEVSKAGAILDLVEDYGKAAAQNGANTVNRVLESTDGTFEKERLTLAVKNASIIEDADS